MKSIFWTYYTGRDFNPNSDHKQFVILQQISNFKIPLIPGGTSQKEI